MNLKHKSNEMQGSDNDATNFIIETDQHDAAQREGGGRMRAVQKRGRRHDDQSDQADGVDRETNLERIVEIRQRYLAVLEGQPGAKQNE